MPQLFSEELPKEVARLDAPVFTGGDRLQDEKRLLSRYLKLQSCQEWATCYTTPSCLASLTRALAISR
jgi:hypothetical protein